jgi:hypothetical protein
MENDDATMTLEFVTEIPNEDQNESSVVMFETSQVRTKKERELLGTNVAVTPVRRSVRLSSMNEKCQDDKQRTEKKYIVQFHCCLSIFTEEITPSLVIF